MNMNNLILPSYKPFEIAKTTSQINISDVFNRRQETYLNEFTLFLAYFNVIPNFIHEVDIDCKKANKWFFENYQSEIKDFCYTKMYADRSKKVELDDIFYFLYDDLIVYFDISASKVRFLFRKTDLAKVETLINHIHKFKKRKQKRKPEVLLLVNDVCGIETKNVQITKSKLSIVDNYNENFEETHAIIVKRLARKNDKGLVLLHGKPGTGKTAYIRYLIGLLQKNVIFLPPNMVNAITDPSFISILIKNPNSVFVIEDAENIIIDRENHASSSVSTLLNMTDGLLADCLNIQIICSFNIDISKIDAALMRKGRLIAKYEFKELEAEKAQKLSNKLGFHSIINEPMTLTSIYNQDEKDFEQNKKSNPIGFRREDN